MLHNPESGQVYAAGTREWPWAVSRLRAGRWRLLIFSWLDVCKPVDREIEIPSGSMKSLSVTLEPGRALEGVVKRMPNRWGGVTVKARWPLPANARLIDNPHGWVGQSVRCKGYTDAVYFFVAEYFVFHHPCHLGGALQWSAHGQGDIQVEFSLVDLGNQFPPKLRHDAHDGGEKCHDSGAEDDSRIA